MEEVSKRFERSLHLSEREAKGLKIGARTAAAAARRKFTIICKVLKNKPAHAKTFIEVFSSRWKGTADVHISEAEGDRFLAVFDNQADMMAVLSKEPWEFDNCLVVMAPLNSAKSPLNVQLNSAPFWIQANVPPDYRIRETAIDLGDFLGEFKDVKVNDKGLCIGKCVCMLVRIPVDVPLIRETFIDFPEFPDTLVEFRYERLPSFCQDCGRLDHPTRQCFIKRGVMNVPEKERNFRLTLRASSDVFGRKILTRLTQATFSNSDDSSRKDYSGSEGPSWRRENELSDHDGVGDKSSTDPSTNLNAGSSNHDKSVEEGPTATSPLKTHHKLLETLDDVLPTRDGHSTSFNEEPIVDSMPTTNMIRPTSLIRTTPTNVSSNVEDDQFQGSTHPLSSQVPTVASKKNSVRQLGEIFRNSFEKEMAVTVGMDTNTDGRTTPIPMGNELIGRRKGRIRNSLINTTSEPCQGANCGSKRIRSDDEDDDFQPQNKKLLVTVTSKVMGAAGLPHHDQ